MDSKIIKLAIAILFFNVSANAQTKADLFGNSYLPVTFLGLDFTKASYIGDPGTVSPSEMKNLFNSINILMISEPKKYDFKTTFRKDKMESNISVTEERNKTVDQDNLLTFDSKKYKSLDEKDISAMIKNYKFDSGNKGVGLVFIMEGLNKMIEQASMWVTFVNMDTKEIIFTQRIEGKAAGFGFRNHWAGAIYSALKEIDSHQFKEWKKANVPSK